MTEIARWQIDALLISPCALQRFMQIQNDDGEMTVSPVSETSEPSTPSTPAQQQRPLRGLLAQKPALPPPRSSSSPQQHQQQQREQRPPDGEQAAAAARPTPSSPAPYGPTIRQQGGEKDG